jgi:structure-specific recognition protein 1
VITKIFRGLSGKKVIMPSKDFVRSVNLHPILSLDNSADISISHHGHSGVKCSIKANEGLLFCLDKSFMFVPKPATYIQIENISVITMSRVGGAISASRTFDITISLKGGLGEHQFSNINRYDYLRRPLHVKFPSTDKFLSEEQQPLEEFFKAKNIRFKNEMVDDVSFFSY